MPNITPGFWSRFGRRPATGNNNANKNLERNVGIYVQSYLKNRNTPNKVPPLNNLMANALHKYINAKRARVAGAAAAAVHNAGGTNNSAAAAGAGAAQTPSNASPSTAGNNAANAAKRAGANATQQAAAAAGAANEQALVLHKPPAAAQQAGAEAAAAAAQQAAPNATLTQQAQTANAGAAAANVNGKRAALEVLLQGKNEGMIMSPNMMSIADVEKLKANLEAININNNRKKAVLNLINKRLRENVAEGASGSGGSANLNSLRGAVNQNTNVMNKAQATSELRRLNVLLKKVGQVNNANLKTKINNYRRRLNARAATVSSNEVGNKAPLEMNINVPGTNLKVKVKRNNPGSNWQLVNNANKARYNLNNKNRNVPKIRNIGTGNMFKQGN